jgi:hypothetical protein
MMLSVSRLYSVDDWTSNEYGCYTLMRKMIVAWLVKSFLAFHKPEAHYHGHKSPLLGPIVPCH